LRLHGLPPAIGRQTQQLMLGTFLGATSLARQQYYALPQTAFWKVFQAILPSSPYAIRADSYENRINWMLGKGIDLWDVYAFCEREGRNSFLGLLPPPMRHAVALQEPIQRAAWCCACAASSALFPVARIS
jgi:G:T/U-mismatch repair DNA glycosylase